MARYYGATFGLLLVGSIGLMVVAWRFAFFLLPLDWTGEPARLAQLLRAKAGSTIADVGAGDGSLALEMARLVGEGGLVYATELSAERRRDIHRRVSQAAAGNLRIVAADIDATHLPDACCDGVYMRAVLHHVSNPQEFARQIRQAVRPGGRVAVIDFTPGALWFHGADHGIESDQVIDAFRPAGFALAQRIDKWGGGTWLLLFERDN